MTTPTLLTDGLYFPESPRWHAGRLWFSDFFHRQVFSVAEDGSGLRSELALADDSPSGLGWMPDGRLRVVAMHRRQLLTREADGALSAVDLAPHTAGLCNDLLVDAAGRAYVGNFGFDLYAREAPRPTDLLRVDPDGSVQVAARGVTFPNGMALSPDGATLILAETHAARLSAFDVDAGGGLSGRRVWADLPGCFPDGLCRDAEGAVWVADAGGRRLLRLREGGAVVQALSTGTRGAYACALGGADGRSLFICCAPGIGPKAARAPAGALLHARVDVPGDHWA